MTERWPPAYDSEELGQLIVDIRRQHNRANFFDLRKPIAQYCQGDVVRLDCGLPHIDDLSDPAVRENPSQLWLILGNTCDFTRDIDDLPWTQLIPVLELDAEAISTQGFLEDLQAYRMSRHFYVPDWISGNTERHFMAEFSTPVTAHKNSLSTAQLQARLSRSAWILLNACCVRFLARDDQRFSE